MKLYEKWLELGLNPDGHEWFSDTTEYTPKVLRKHLVNLIIIIREGNGFLGLFTFETINMFNRAAITIESNYPQLSPFPRLSFADAYVSNLLLRC